MEHVTDGVCDGVCDGVWLFGKDSFEECPLTITSKLSSLNPTPSASPPLLTHQWKLGNALQRSLHLIPLFTIVVPVTIVVLQPLFSFPLFLAVYNVGLILAEAPSYSFWTSC